MLAPKNGCGGLVGWLSVECREQGAMKLSVVVVVVLVVGWTLCSISIVALFFRFLFSHFLPLALSSHLPFFRFLFFVRYFSFFSSLPLSALLSPLPFPQFLHLIRFVESYIRVSKSTLGYIKQQVWSFMPDKPCKRYDIVLNLFTGGVVQISLMLNIWVLCRFRLSVIRC